ncbi:hypothetical protein C7413_101366 [Paraburkholderia silvatlantica]|nr:hypothetical protein C7411_101364 [Paraburkholderia silvatlantica]PXW42711.1 hypothetical protein C7413_101366 [Paraburkholderia silvatlantica]
MFTDTAAQLVHARGASIDEKSSADAFEDLSNRGMPWFAGKLSAGTRGARQSRRIPRARWRGSRPWAPLPWPLSLGRGREHRPSRWQGGRSCGRYASRLPRCPSPGVSPVPEIRPCPPRLRGLLRAAVHGDTAPDPRAAGRAETATVNVCFQVTTVTTITQIALPSGVGMSAPYSCQVSKSRLLSDGIPPAPGCCCSLLPRNARTVSASVFATHHSDSPSQ